MADKRISQLVERTDIANNDVVPIVASGATTTNKATISSIQEFMQENLDLGVTSVGITLGSTGTDVNVTGSPITTSGNITINIPDASASNRGVVTTGTQTFAGEKTFTGANTNINGTLVLRTFPALPGLILQSNSPNAFEVGATISGTTYYSSIVFPAGTQSWNLPNASGTIALTSDLSGYVTLGTAQTITAQKTFSTSGSSDTAIINHGSGSGIALNITKGGNNEALRVNKTSGSGNAMTVIGGNFEAPTIVKTGGTSSQFLKADGSVDSNTYLTTASASAAYVPYTGANSNLDLGQFDLFADTIIVNGSSPTSGSYLGFKHATTVTTGAEGFTSMYTFGTNTIGFKSVSGATNKDFSFDMSAITANVSGGRVYTLPDASGTLALTSNLSAYLPLSGGTLTGALNGTSAAFSSSVTAEGTFTGKLNALYQNGSTNILNVGTDQAMYGGTNSDGGLFVYGNNKLHLSTNSQRRLTIDGSGNVGIGTTSPSSGAGWTPTLVLNATNTALVVKGVNGQENSFGTSNGLFIDCLGNSTGTNNNIIFRTSASNSSFSATEKMRITSGGDVSINTTESFARHSVYEGNKLVQFIYHNSTNDNAAISIRHNRANLAGETGKMITFFTSGSNQVGSITSTNTTTSYNTSSDYRLKQDLKEINGLEKVSALKVYDFQWKDSENRMDGVLAHELAEVMPYAVYGEKDAIDEEGNDIMQGVDYSKIVPVLIKAIQELKTEIDSLKNQINK
jgi:hypothetical protein